MPYVEHNQDGDLPLEHFNRSMNTHCVHHSVEPCSTFTQIL